MSSASLNRQFSYIMTNALNVLVLLFISSGALEPMNHPDTIVFNFIAEVCVFDIMMGCFFFTLYLFVL